MCCWFSNPLRDSNTCGLPAAVSVRYKGSYNRCDHSLRLTSLMGQAGRSWWRSENVRKAYYRSPPVGCNTVGRLPVFWNRVTEAISGQCRASLSKFVSAAHMRHFPAAGAVRVCAHVASECVPTHRENARWRLTRRHSLCARRTLRREGLSEC